MDLTAMKQRLIDAGRLKSEDERELFDTLAEHAPEMLAILFAASLAGISVTEQEPERNDH